MKSRFAVPAVFLSLALTCAASAGRAQSTTDEKSTENVASSSKEVRGILMGHVMFDRGIGSREVAGSVSNTIHRSESAGSSLHAVVGGGFAPAGLASSNGAAVEGERNGVTLQKNGDADLPTEYALHQNYPNPFNPVTTIRFDLPEESFVKLVIYDVMGRVILTVQDVFEADRHGIQWDGKNSAGISMASGVYFCHITAHSRVSDRSIASTVKMMLLK